MKTVLIVGQGGREHCLAWKLSKSEHVGRIYVAPGNAGTALVAENVNIGDTNAEELLRFVESERIDLTIIGPEAALHTGLQDHLRAAAHQVVGPSAECFRLESSKAYAKAIMARAHVPTARARVFNQYEEAARYVSNAGFPVVVKVDGLAAGKGVTPCQTEGEALQAIEDALIRQHFGDAGKSVLVEERLRGTEVSLMCLVDGKKAVPLPVAQDHKRLLDGDLGPNTGGMGALAPLPFLSKHDVDLLVEQTVTPVVKEMAALGHPYRGVLFAGLMLTDKGPRVLEYNCRFGDPETQAVLPLIEEDLFSLLVNTATGELPAVLATKSSATVAVVLAGLEYPKAPSRDLPISGLNAGHDGAMVFHAGTKLDSNGTTVTNGGRVLTVVGQGASVAEARRSAYSAPIRFDGMRRRMDIGLSAATTDAPDVGGSRRPEQGQRVRPQIVVLASGFGSNLQALIDAESSGRLLASITGVISHDLNARSLERARAARIRHAFLPIISRRDSAARKAHEEALVETIADWAPDMLVLAGWMLVLSADALAAIERPLINVHPALLPLEGTTLDIPVLRGHNVVRDALSLHLPYTGVSVHHVVPEVDSGPVIVREAVSILEGDTVTSLHERLKLVEHRLLVEAINALAREGLPSISSHGTIPVEAITR